MDPEVIGAASPVIAAVIGLIGLHLWLADKRDKRAKMGDEAELIAKLRAENRELDLSRRAYMGHYSRPPLELQEYEPEEGEELRLGDLAETVVDNLPAWVKPLLNSPLAEKFILSQIEKHPEWVEKLFRGQEIPTLDPKSGTITPPQTPKNAPGGIQ